MRFVQRSTIVVLTIAAALLTYAPAGTAQFADTGGIAAPACLEPVDGFTWLRWTSTQPSLDLWCHSVGRPIF